MGIAGLGRFGCGNTAFFWQGVGVDIRDCFGFGFGLVAVELLLEGGYLAAELAELLFLGGGAVFGVEVGVVEEFDEGARFAAFDGEEGGFVAFEVDAGQYHVLVHRQGIFEGLALAALGSFPLAALFDGGDGVFVKIYC